MAVQHCARCGRDYVPLDRLYDMKTQAEKVRGMYWAEALLWVIGVAVDLDHENGCEACAVDLVAGELVA